MWLDSPSPIITKAQSGLRVVRPSVACALLLRPPIFSSARYLQLLKPAATAMGLDYCRLLHRQVRHAWGVDAIVLLLCFYDDIQTTALTTPGDETSGEQILRKLQTSQPGPPDMSRNMRQHIIPTYPSDAPVPCSVFRRAAASCCPAIAFPRSLQPCGVSVAQHVVMSLFV